jgi:hypothetical protein
VPREFYRRCECHRREKRECGAQRKGRWNWSDGACKRVDVTRRAFCRGTCGRIYRRKYRCSKTTGAVVGFPIRGPDGRSQDHRCVSERFGGNVLARSAALLRRLSSSLVLSAFLDGDAALAGSLTPAMVTSWSLRLYPNIESPSMELWRVKFGMDFTGLAERDVGVGGRGSGRLQRLYLLSVCTRSCSSTGVTPGLTCARMVGGSGVGEGEGVERVAPAFESIR